MTPIAFTIEEACAATHSGRGTIYTAIRTGALCARKRGKRTFILADDLRNWMASLPTYSPMTAHQSPPRRAATRAAA